uniref:Carbohydrate sulfotransferase n=1 Tax=Oikopleura dioica TaxID=34765 RepID=Q66S82_OIKDI|nr:N-acetylgalactosamine 4-O-sulfotransferase-like protein [Oikopleura dioica]
MPPSQIYFIAFFIFNILLCAAYFRFKTKSDEIFLDKKVFEKREIEEIFEKRKIIYNRACKALPLIEEFVKNESSFEDLLKFHDQIHDVNFPLPKIPEISCKTNVIPRSSVFNASESMNLLICLPPKCGTSNWQKAIDVHFLNITQGQKAAKEFEEKIKNNTAGMEVYGLIPRIKTEKLFRAKENGEDPKNIYKSKYKVANVRNPFARVFSAWHDKMRNGTDHLIKYGKYFEAIGVFEDFENIPEKGCKEEILEILYKKRILYKNGFRAKTDFVQKNGFRTKNGFCTKNGFRTKNGFCSKNKMVRNPFFFSTKSVFVRNPSNLKTNFFCNHFKENYFYSFEAFVEYIASNPGDSKKNGHWGTLFRQCSACSLNFSLITHLENSKKEIPFLLEKINLKNEINVGGQYTWNGTKRILEESDRPPDELHWQNVPKETAKLIYKHYYLDFIIFGYSTEEVLKYVHSSNSRKQRPASDKITSSRKYLQSFGKQNDHFKKFSDFICTN